MIRTYRSHLALALATVLLASLASTPAEAQRRNRDNAEANATEQAAEIDRKPVNCIVENRIERSVLVNDRTVLFFMRGGLIYRNDLLQSCQGIAPGEDELEFQLENTGSAKLARLCDDSFSVQRRRGFACLLGKYNPVTAEEAQALLPPAQ